MSVGCPVDITGPPLVWLVRPVDHDGQLGDSAGLPCRGPAFPGLRIEQGRRRGSSSVASRSSAVGSAMTRRVFTVVDTQTGPRQLLVDAVGEQRAASKDRKPYNRSGYRTSTPAVDRYVAWSWVICRW
jgi:hypothetical protein